MTTLKDYKEKVLKSFERKFFGCIDDDKRDLYKERIMLNDLSLAIDNAVVEAFKAVEVEKRNHVGMINNRHESQEIYTCLDCLEDEWQNKTLQEVEDRKKQYLV
jgi:hypothetical protein